VAPPQDAHVQRLRGPGGAAVLRDGPAEVLLIDLRRHERWIKPLVVVIALLPAARLAYLAANNSLGANPIEALEVATGTWALRFLAATLAITPLRRLTGWGGAARYRRLLGLVTFTYATLHLLVWAVVDFYFAFDLMWEEIRKHQYILLGMATYLMLLPLAVTSTKGWVRRLGGRRWARLHRLIYVAAITATIHYLWAVKKDTLLPLVYLSIFVALLGVRLAWAKWPRRLASGGPAT
jgi:methionine sulfoxide reductase heme-binding subunit